MLKKIFPYIVIVVVVVIIRTFIVTPIRVSGSSMYPTIKDGNVMILVKVTKYFKDYQRNDIVVLKENGDYLIKRVIWLNGERIACHDGKIYINDSELDNDYGIGETNDFTEVLIGKNSYFVMGDNRAISKDSRIIGTVSEKEILGYANLIIYPFKSIDIVK